MIPYGRQSIDNNDVSAVVESLKSDWLTTGPQVEEFENRLEAVLGAKLEEVGMRPGEKLHEEMISSDDSRRTIILEDRFVVTPVVAEWGYLVPAGITMEEGRAYRSDTNELWMTQADIKNFIAKS